MYRTLDTWRDEVKRELGVETLPRFDWPWAYRTGFTVREAVKLYRDRGAEQDKYIGRAVTLNGKPAKIVRQPDGFAAVAPLDPALGVVPYSWTAVYNVCDNRSGRFE